MTLGFDNLKERSEIPCFSVYHKNYKISHNRKDRTQVYNINKGTKCKKKYTVMDHLLGLMPNGNPCSHASSQKSYTFLYSLGPSQYPRRHLRSFLDSPIYPIHYSLPIPNFRY